MKGLKKTPPKRATQASYAPPPHPTPKSHQEITSDFSILIKKERKKEKKKEKKKRFVKRERERKLSRRKKRRRFFF